METQIQQREEKISAMLETIPDILKDDGYPDVQAFMATYCKAEVIVNNYNRELAEWERKGQRKKQTRRKRTVAPPEKQSVRDQLRRLQAEADRPNPSIDPTTEKDNLTPKTTPQGSFPALRDYILRAAKRKPPLSICMKILANLLTIIVSMRII